MLLGDLLAILRLHVMSKRQGRQVHALEKKVTAHSDKYSMAYEEPLWCQQRRILTVVDVRTGNT